MINKITSGLKYLAVQDLPLWKTILFLLKVAPKEVYSFMVLSSDKKLVFLDKTVPEVLCRELSQVVGCYNKLLEYHAELVNDSVFHNAIHDKLLDVPERANKYPPIGYRELLYLIIRVMKPNVFIETGSYDGLSTAYILLGLHKNEKGNCTTIDLPNPRLPKGKQSAWIVPDYLRDRLTLIEGKTSEHLQSAIDRNGEIDMFYHDSWHSYNNMMFEYETAWKGLRKGGIFISEYIYYNNSFKDFTKDKKPIMLAGDSHFIIHK